MPTDAPTAPETAADIRARLGLRPHDEGGFFRETYRAAETIACPDRPGEGRALLTVIHYLLESAAPRGIPHRNRSDIVHFHEGGGRLRYLTLTPDGVLGDQIIGPGHERQVTVPGGVWKATELLDGEWGLVGEAVSPGFDYRDREIADRATLERAAPDAAHRFAPFWR